jgi:tetratricopeptide (TPR) repeat protein
MQGRDVEAEPLFRRALDIFDAQSRIDDLEVAQLHGLTLDDLAVIYAVRAKSAAPPSAKQDQLKEAERLFQRALAIREKSDPGQVGRSLSNLTQLYTDWDRLSEAAVAAQRAVSFYERQRGPEDEEVVYQLDRLADIYLQQGRLAEAEPIIGRVVSGMQKTLGPNHPAIARRLESYAVGLRKAGREADAREVDTQAQKIRDNAPKRP